MAFEICEYFEKIDGQTFQLVAMGADHFVLANIQGRALNAAAIGQVWSRDEFLAAIGRGYFRRMRTH